MLFTDFLKLFLCIQIILIVFMHTDQGIQVCAEQKKLQLTLPLPYAH